MENSDIKTNSLKAWVLAARPKTLTAASVPVMIGTAIAWHTFPDADIWVSKLWIPTVLCFLFAFVMQIDANFVNDYFDFKRGNDDETRLGPKRACAEGWVTPGAMKTALFITTILGCLIGLPLIIYGGVEMIAVGIACVVFCFLYTTTLAYLGLGDVLVLVFFGIVPVCCTCYVEMPWDISERFFDLNWMNLILMSIAVGFVIDTLLIINNYRDIDNDRKAGKKTIAVLLGKKPMEWLYIALPLIGVAIPVALYTIEGGLIHLLPCLMLFLFVSTWRKMVSIGEGRELNKVLGLTARNIFLYGLLTSLSVIL